MKTLWLTLLLGATPTQGFPADSTQKLVDQYGCMACHGLVHKQVGPGFAQIAARYAADPKAADYLAGRVRNGAVGNWGRVIMPRQARMSEAESLVLARWVLSQPVR